MSNICVLLQKVISEAPEGKMGRGGLLGDGDGCFYGWGVRKDRLLSQGKVGWRQPSAITEI